MTMNRDSMNSLRSLLFLGTLFGLMMSLSAEAQEKKTFSFGPPLRANIVFAYKYSERLHSVQQMHGEIVDSSDRTLTYFITERILPGENGTFTVEANVDSMRIEASGMGDKVSFNTQQLKGSEEMVRHREVLAVSSLVNRMVTFTLSPYGEVIKIESQALQELLQQAQATNVDAFTRERVRSLAGNGYLASVFLPWRGLTPVGRTVNYGDNVSMPFWSSIDLLSFNDTATVTVQRSTDATPGPTVSFTATLDNPLNKMMTATAITEPMKLVKASGSINGQLRLDEDGSVLSGWTALKGSAESEYDGQTLSSNFTQETYIDLLGLMPF
jgi:hypothetical protein